MMLSHEVPHAIDTSALPAGVPATDLVRAGRDPQDLAREFEPSAQAIRSWVAEADRREGRREPKPAVVETGLGGVDKAQSR